MENFQNSLLSLSHILDEPLPEIDDERGKVHLYFCIEKFFSGEGEHLPSIQFCDVSTILARKYGFSAHDAEIEEFLLKLNGILFYC